MMHCVLVLNIAILTVLYRIVVQEVTIPSTAMEGGEDELTISISDMLLSMNAKWKYKQKGWYKYLHCTHNMSNKMCVKIKAICCELYKFIVGLHPLHFRHV